MFWKFVFNGDKLKILPSEPLLCPFCGSKLKPHHTGRVHKPLNGYAIDVGFKCPYCSFFATFGIPIDGKLAEKLKKYENYFFKWWEEEDNSEVKERLKALGYW